MNEGIQASEDSKLSFEVGGSCGVVCNSQMCASSSPLIVLIVIDRVRKIE